MDFQIRPAAAADVPQILTVMDRARAALPVPEWFVADDAAYLHAHLDGPLGFCLVAETPGRSLAAYFTVKLAGTAPDALGRYLSLDDQALRQTAQMDSCCVVPGCRGHSLEGRLLLECEARLRSRPDGPWRRCLATVHPDNLASLYSFLHRGYSIAAENVLCYGGKRRHILAKLL